MSHLKGAGSYHIPMEMLPVSVSWNGKGHQKYRYPVVHGATLREYDIINIIIV